MNEQKNPLCEKVSISYKTLQKTMFESDADMAKQLPKEEEAYDISKILEDGD